MRTFDGWDDPAPGYVEADLVAHSGPTARGSFVRLRTAWRKGEIRPTAKAKEKAVRGRRRSDPLAAVAALLQGWHEAEPWRTSRELLERLQAEQPGIHPDGLLRTLQRRLKGWRREVAHTLVLGTALASTDAEAATALEAENVT